MPFFAARAKTGWADRRFTEADWRPKHSLTFLSRAKICFGCRTLRV